MNIPQHATSLVEATAGAALTPDGKRPTEGETPDPRFCPPFGVTLATRERACILDFGPIPRHQDCFFVTPCVTFRATTHRRVGERRVNAS